MSLMGIWYGLSVNDWHFGTRIFSRELHDLVFQIYGKLLGMEPEALPALLAKAVIFDTLIVFGIVAYRWRAKWWPTVRQYFRPEANTIGSSSPAE